MWVDKKARPGPWVAKITDVPEGVKLQIVASDGVVVASSHKIYESKAEVLVAYTLVRQGGLLHHNVARSTENYSYNGTIGSKNHYLVTEPITVSDEAFITGKQIVRLLQKNDSLKL